LFAQQEQTMSVAFRRESDDEHLEPKFEIPIPPGPNLVTRRGLALIGERIAELAANLAAEDDETRRKSIQRELRYWQTREVTAEVMPAPSGAIVEFGTRATILLKGKQRTLALVGDDEADPAAGLLSFSAPLARAIMGAEPGDIVEFAGDEEAIEVLSVEPIS
jgi:transcription elongation GreA/GreB family factor